MRVTQSMLSNNMLRNLNTSYGKMSKLQEQINSGSKITRPSDDPVIAIKGMQYRTELGKVEQYTRNLNEAYSWLDTSDQTLGEVTESLTRVQELITQAANDSNTSDDRKKMAVEIEQIQQQLRDAANTQISGKYIFSGTHTNSPLYSDVETGTMIDKTVKNGVNSDVRVELSAGIQISLNTQGYNLFSGIDTMMSDVINELNDPNATGDTIGQFLTNVQSEVDNAIQARSEVGAKQNRVDLIANRLSLQEINVTKQMSLNEDVDYSKAITEMTTQESIHQAALSVGSKIIQQTLINFL